MSRRSVNQWEARVSALVRRVCFELAAFFFFSNEEISRDRPRIFLRGNDFVFGAVSNGSFTRRLPSRMERLDNG